jgi:N-acetylglucosamine-6-phosphate deacetylase
MLLHAAGVIDGHDVGVGVDSPGWLRIEHDRIAEVGSGARPGPEESLGDVLLAPGFVDLQINGIDEIDFAATDADVIAALERITDSGCTTCVPTLVTAPIAAYDAMLDQIARARVDPNAGDRCTVAGVHLEGPFLGGAPGAHPIELIRPVDMAALEAWVDRHRDLIRIVTIAPEADPEFVATRWLAARGIVVAVGHTSADYGTATSMIDAGATLVTHLFNGMTPFHHRDPGTPGAALRDDRVTASLIVDGVHVHPAAAAIAAAAKRSVALITDAVATRGVEVGADGAARLADGTLAGSTLTMDAAVRNIVEFGVDVSRAIRMASTIPAAVLGLSDRGVLAPGRRADLVALDRTTLQVRGVWIAGARVR